MPQQPDLSFEQALWQSGVRLLAGIDEAGRGALAGPVFAAAVILPDDPACLDVLSGVRDSKQMTARQRTFWADQIKITALAWGIAWVEAQQIDQIGILPATRLAARRAIEALKPAPEHLLLDYLKLSEYGARQTSLVKGDARCLSIAAASVLAKTARDAQMLAYHRQYPAYGFAQHKGYGTQAHLAALEQSGPCPIHRRSFAPVARLVSGLFPDPTI